ncbi:helix-turn-helix domain-containing protein [Achromobacter deleyi]|uniref:helix-turn-helix domain-containing protein n=1 Tax=Achromobacter deleyi TaxID=1353891 RepID=UPI001491F9F5|nr:helix-turn-helix transcriptional regulator [Achromobacter deleyi]QVQ25309.1 helix-turn-helix transcriptional regulator [Achromobacter deleyi]UIP20850.1 helix-turn-helix transcriptional regulator [Achromobacter deleyi]
MSLAHRLRTLMRWRGIHSQNQLARISGVPQSCIHRILTRPEHRYSPARGTLVRLAQALDTSVPWLTDGVSPTSAPGGAPWLQDGASGNGDGYCTEICALLRQQTDNTKRTVLTVVRLIIEKQGAA